MLVTNGRDIEEASNNSLFLPKCENSQDFSIGKTLFGYLLSFLMIIIDFCTSVS